jgi:ATP-dependent DNA helicase RecG
VTKKPFVKPALSIAQQVEQLRTRGMEMGDDARAAFYLQHLDYYRLGVYWIPSSPNNDPSSPNNDPSSLINDPSSLINDPSSLNNDPSSPYNDPSFESNESTAADLVGGRRTRTATSQIVLEFCREEYRTPKEISLHLRRDLKYVKRWVLSELLFGNKLQARYPENPTHPQQAYRATDP